ncbi:MAG: hypothetical protein AB1656_19875 [Candidatus Omnitrophota bacterium]
MKRAGLAIALLGIVVMLASAQDQQPPRRGFRGQAVMILCDVLMLNPELSEKVVTVYTDISAKRREAMQSGSVDFQSMSDQERRDFFTKMQKETAADMKKELKEVLSEKELEEVEGALTRRVFFPDAELRALRLLELKKEQREKLQPLAITLGKKMVPADSPFAGVQMEAAEREKAEKEYQKEKESFMTKAGEVLSEEQNNAWKEKVKEVNKEIEEMRERMRSFQRQ